MLFAAMIGALIGTVGTLIMVSDNPRKEIKKVVDKAKDAIKGKKDDSN